MLYHQNNRHARTEITPKLQQIITPFEYTSNQPQIMNFKIIISHIYMYTFGSSLESLPNVMIQENALAK